ncbi:MAG: rhomboid family intramembrane serine protease [Woeseiaceae bacterium]
MEGADFVAIFEARDRAAVSERALVLQSVGLPYQIVTGELGAALLVPAAVAERAKFEIREYEQENRPRRRTRATAAPRYQDGIPGVLAYLVVLCAVGWLAGNDAFGRDWLAAGRIDGELLRAGEWWRTITALTLHADLSHLSGNILFGMLFGFFAGRLVGSGVAWLVILAAAAAANLLNTLLLDAAHRAIGASTAVFAALGLVAAYIWRAGFMMQEHWAYRFGPVVGGVALLAYTGTGDESTDIGAHLTGFASGFAAGLVLVMLGRWFTSRAVQPLSGLAALLMVASSWWLAL